MFGELRGRLGFPLLFMAWGGNCTFTVIRTIQIIDVRKPADARRIPSSPGFDPRNEQRRWELVARGRQLHQEVDGDPAVEMVRGASVKPLI